MVYLESGIASAWQRLVWQSIRKNGLLVKITQESPESAESGQQADARIDKRFTSSDGLTKNLADP